MNRTWRNVWLVMKKTSPKLTYKVSLTPTSKSCCLLKFQPGLIFTALGFNLIKFLTSNDFSRFICHVHKESVWKFGSYRKCNVLLQKPSTVNVKLVWSDLNQVLHLSMWYNQLNRYKNFFFFFFFIFTHFLGFCAQIFGTCSKNN